MAETTSAFAENLRSALIADPTLIQGYFMMSLLEPRKQPVQIIEQVRMLMKPKDVSKTRLELIYDQVHRCGLGYGDEILERKDTWRESRFIIATHNHSKYEMDMVVLNRIVAIDEQSILSGRLELVVAVIKFRVLAFEFIVNGKATNQVIENFLRNKVAPQLQAAAIADPIIIWDNINVHKGSGVTAFIENNRWIVWPQPVNSDDMHPWDYADKLTFKSMIRKDLKAPDITIEEAQRVVVDAINAINSEGALQGVVQLPSKWEGLLETKGLSTIP